jgi:hypothetical protein
MDRVVRVGSWIVTGTIAMGFQIGRVLLIPQPIIMSHTRGLAEAFDLDGSRDSCAGRRSGVHYRYLNEWNRKLAASCRPPTHKVTGTAAAS